MIVYESEIEYHKQYLTNREIYSFLGCFIPYLRATLWS